MISEGFGSYVTQYVLCYIRVTKATKKGDVMSNEINFWNYSQKDLQGENLKLDPNSVESKILSLFGEEEGGKGSVSKQNFIDIIGYFKRFDNDGNKKFSQAELELIATDLRSKTGLNVFSANVKSLMNKMLEKLNIRNNEEQSAAEKAEAEQLAKDFESALQEFTSAGVDGASYQDFSDTNNMSLLERACIEAVEGNRLNKEKFIDILSEQFPHLRENDKLAEKLFKIFKNEYNGEPYYVPEGISFLADISNRTLMAIDKKTDLGLEQVGNKNIYKSPEGEYYVLKGTVSDEENFVVPPFQTSVGPDDVLNNLGFYPVNIKDPSELESEDAMAKALGFKKVVHDGNNGKLLGEIKALFSERVPNGTYLDPETRTLYRWDDSNNKFVYVKSLPAYFSDIEDDKSFDDGTARLDITMSGGEDYTY